MYSLIDITSHHTPSSSLLFPPYPHSYVPYSILSINQGLGNISLKGKREREREGYKKQGKKRKDPGLYYNYNHNHHKENRRVGQVDQVDHQVGR